MKIGYIVAVRRGSKWIAFTRVMGNYELLSDEQTADLAWFKRRRQVEVLDWYQPDIYPVEPCGNYQSTLIPYVLVRQQIQQRILKNGMKEL